MKGDIKYQPVLITVTAANATVPIEFDTDKLYQHCTGIYFSVPDDSVITSTLSRFEIGSKEIFPDGYEIKMLNTTSDVPVDERYYSLREPAKGSRVKSRYNDSGLSSSYPYNVVLYLRLQNE